MRRVKGTHCFLFAILRKRAVVTGGGAFGRCSLGTGFTGTYEEVAAHEQRVLAAQMQTQLHQQTGWGSMQVLNVPPGVSPMGPPPSHLPPLSQQYPLGAFTSPGLLHDTISAHQPGYYSNLSTPFPAHNPGTISVLNQPGSISVLNPGTPWAY